MLRFIRVAVSVAAVLLLGVSGEKVVPFANPRQIQSQNGLLDVTIIDSMATVLINGVPTLARVWNESFIAPTFVLSRGDRVIIRFVNNLSDEPTNLHFHGLRVTPIPPGDNIFIQIAPNGGKFTYNFTIPDNHPQGMFWYHSHAHMYSDFQVFNGMSGALIVTGLLEPFPELSGVQQQVLCLRDVQVTNGTIEEPNYFSSPPQPSIRFINGLVQPTLQMKKSETQLFSIANIGADIYYKLKVISTCKKPLKFFRIAIDGIRQIKLIEWDTASGATYLIGPGSRAEFLVEAPDVDATYTIITEKMKTGQTGPDGFQLPRVKLMTIQVSKPTAKKVKLTSPFPPLTNLVDVPIAMKRKVVFSENLDIGQFYINGKMFNASRVDFTVKLGTVEEWSIENDSKEFHHFHIHQGSYQVMSVGGKKREFTGYQDSVVVRYKRANEPFPVIVRIPFIDPIKVGKYVFHCKSMIISKSTD